MIQTHLSKYENPYYLLVIVIIKNNYVYIEYVDLISTFYDKYVGALTLPDWKVITEDKKVGLTIWQRSDSRGLKAMKAEAYIDRSPEEIFRYIGDLSYRKDYDDTYDDGYALDKIADQTFI